VNNLRPFETQCYQASNQNTPSPAPPSSEDTRCQRVHSTEVLVRPANVVPEVAHHLNIDDGLHRLG